MDHIPPKPKVRDIPAQRDCDCYGNKEPCETCRYIFGYMRGRNDLGSLTTIWNSLWDDPAYLMGYADGEQDQIEAELNY